MSAGQTVHRIVPLMHLGPLGYLLDSRVEPTSRATDFFVETKVVVCDRGTCAYPLTPPLLLLRNKIERD